MDVLQLDKPFPFCLNLKKAIATFFTKNDPELIRGLFWKMFQCWVTRECQLKAELTDEEIALVLDQLNDLVAAAYNAHQSNRAPENQQPD